MAEGRPTLDTVAEAAGVSRMTVSNAYNRPDQLSAATREHVLAVAATLGYPGPNPAARSLRRRSSGTIGVLLTERLPYAFTDPGLVSLLRGLATELGAAGQSMLLVPAEADDVGEVVRNALVDGFVICSMDESDEAVIEVCRRRQPLVTVGHPRLPGVPLIAIDNVRAAAFAAEHLLHLGHRSFGILNLLGRRPGDTEHRDVPVRFGIDDRVDGFTRAVAAVADTSVVVETAQVHTHDEAVRVARAVLDVAATRRPSAVFCVTDVLALGVLDAARQLGLSVPADVSVVGFDDIEEASRAVPPLTTVKQDLEGKGRVAARAVLDRIAGQKPRVPRLSAHLVVRESTAEVPGRRGRRSHAP
jgi:DNA-binding LacI/PurR family transcriptional regulator